MRMVPPFATGMLLIPPCHIFPIQMLSTVSGTATGNSIGYGMSAGDSGRNSITTGSGHVNVTGSGSSTGTGMYAVESGSNTISSSDALTVTITATAASAQNAVAMWADGGSVNSSPGIRRREALATTSP